MKNINVHYIKNNSVGPSRPSCPSVFNTTLAEVKEQIEYDRFFREQESRTGRTRKYIDPLVSELCLIITETLILNPDAEIRVSGNMLPVGVVQEIFRSLTFEHIELVISNFRETTSRVYNKKAYLRTALYNSAFEHDAHYTNLVKHDMGV